MEQSFGMQIAENIFRWFHVLAGILWIGLLYFFNFVNGPFAATMDGDTKKKVVPELMPRALYFFRFGALFTWVTGVLLLMMVFYHGGIALQTGMWSRGAFIMIAFTFIAPFAYDPIAKEVKNPRLLMIMGLALIGAVLIGYHRLGGFSFRGIVIHMGAMFGTIMAYNVWFRIWPAQRQIITAIKSGQAPDANLVALAGLRSKHNTYLSLPLVWSMVNAHSPFTSPEHWGVALLVVAIGWLGTMQLYKRAGKVKGF